MLASDGLWDNVYSDIIRREIAESSGYVEAAKKLVKRTKEVFLLPEYESPFYTKGMKLGEKVPKAGKVDDTTIILARV